MKKLGLNILTVIIGAILLTLSGCSVMYNLDSFVMPDDLEFIRVIEGLDTPEKICWYTQENFTYKPHAYYTPSPYQFWQIKEGDCNDYSTFVTFVADYHGYESYQIKFSYKEETFGHMIGVFIEDGKYNYSDVWIYYPIQAGSFREIVDFYSGYETRWVVSGYEVYDHKMRSIEEVNNA